MKKITPDQESEDSLATIKANHSTQYPLKNSEHKSNEKRIIKPFFTKKIEDIYQSREDKKLKVMKCDKIIEENNDDLFHNYSKSSLDLQRIQ